MADYAKAHAPPELVQKVDRYIALSDAAPAAELDRYLKSALGPDQTVVNGATFVFRTAA
jgi:hypothetical protein